MWIFKKIWFWVVCLAAIGGGYFAYQKMTEKDPAIQVQTELVAYDEIVQTVTALGRVQPKTKVNISGDVSGKIVTLAVKEGDWVEKGQLLVELERETYEAALEQSEARLRSAQANVNLNNENLLKAEKDYERSKELFSQNLETQASLDETYTTLQVQRALHQSAVDQVEQAKANLKQNRTELAKTTIFAPMSGTISELNKEIGEIALGSQFQEDVIMVLANLNGMEALVNVDENDIINLALGNTATIEIDALPGVSLQGEVTEIANSAKVSASGTTEQKTEFEVKIAITDHHDALRPGMTASADITTRTIDKALVVPIQCVAVRTLEQLKTKPKEPNGMPGQAIADEIQEPMYVADKDGFVEVVFIVENDTVSARQVKSGIQSDTHIEILDGIAEHDQVVTGNYRAISKDLENGSKVQVGQPKS